VVAFKSPYQIALLKEKPSAESEYRKAGVRYLSQKQKY
jgi:hypothetical protein